jgi:hypothetical protein
VEYLALTGLTAGEIATVAESVLPEFAAPAESAAAEGVAVARSAAPEFGLRG